ncbi:hypothetical protein MTBSS4_10327 [Magnetospirillum sp. SS-4]|nr:hypothetical protein MTBSS4_10327 [Magnetospirillum sp. SS-4]
MIGSRSRLVQTRPHVTARQLHIT